VKSGTDNFDEKSLEAYYKGELDDEELSKLFPDPSCITLSKKLNVKIRKNEDGSSPIYNDTLFIFGGVKR